MVDLLHKNKNGGLMFKVDFEKAYDSINQNFLKFTIEKMGFVMRWRNWIMECNSSPFVAILINEAPTKTVKLRKGLRQGCPFSPFLFNMATKVFSCLMNSARRKYLCTSFSIGSQGMSLSHLQYANDTLLFCMVDLESLHNLKRVKMCSDEF